MQERILGPINGYFISVTALVTGPLGESYLGIAKVCAQPPTGFFDAQAVQTVEAPAVLPRVQDALDSAEDLAVEAALKAPPCSSGPHADAPLWAIAYVSRTAGTIHAADMDRLLASARPRNKALGITGILLSFDESFMQYIEGPRAQLELVYRIIRKDPLHHCVVKLLKAEVSERVFPDWSMLYESPTQALWTLRASEPLLAPHRVYPSQVKGMLTMFLERHGARDELLQAASRKFAAPG